MIVSSVMVKFNQDIIDHKQKGNNMYCYKTDPPTTEQRLQIIRHLYHVKKKKTCQFRARYFFFFFW